MPLYDLMTNRPAVYQKDALHSCTNNFLSSVYNHLPGLCFPPVLTAAFILQRSFQQIGFLPPAAQRFISPLKELTNLHQIISLQVSTPWKQIGPKGRHIVIMRERLRGGEKRSQHEAQEVL